MIAPKAAPGQVLCYVQSSTGNEGRYCCTAAMGHEGQHAAHEAGFDNPKVIFTWADKPSQTVHLSEPKSPEMEVLDKIWARYQKAREWRQYTTTPGDLNPAHIFKRGKEAGILEVIGDLAEEAPGG